MKILIACQYYYPEQFKINEICEQLVKDGNSVTVLTGLPNYPKGYIPKEYKWGRKRKEVVNGVQVIRSFEIGRKNGAIGLALNYLSYMVSATFKALLMKKDFDIIFIYQLSPVTMALPGVVLKKRTKKPLYLYCCDIWPESMKNILPNEDSFVFKVVKKFSKYLYSQCDAITVTSKPFINYFTQVHSIPIDRLSYIPQHAEDIGWQLEHSQSEPTSFVFMGNVGIAQDVECILNAAEMLKATHNFRIHIVGDGTSLGDCKIITKNKGLENFVFFYGHQPIDKMPEYYNLADACLLTMKADNLIGLTMPSKLQGYMAAGKVVIGAINGAAQEIINESKCGICVNASDVKALAAAMREFIENPQKYKDCGKNGRQYYQEHFTKAIFIKGIEDKLNELVEEQVNA